VQASLITEQPKFASWEFTPLIEHCGAEVVVETLVVVGAVVEMGLVVVDLVVVDLVVVDVVVVGLVVSACRLSLVLLEVQEAVTVISVIGTKEQKP
jgi:hypothetical protein